MKKRWFALFLVLVMLFCSACAAEESKGILYRVKNGRNDMYLLGSIHVGSREMYPMSDAIMEAVANADVLAFECDTESAEALQDALKLMSYPIGDSVEKHISAETFELLEKAAQKTGNPIGMLKALKPWAIVSMFSVETTAAEMGTEDISEAMELGVETQIRLLAEEKEIHYLETAKDQLQMMDGFSPELQDYLLSTACQAILEPDQAGTTLRLWPEWWRDGNAEGFVTDYYAEQAVDAPEGLLQEYHEKLLLQRNVQMALELQKLLEAEETHSYFVTVGLLHLVLPGESIPDELEKLGYQVERILE